LLVAIVASYTALDMAGRISCAQGRAANWWLAGGASAMGTGIWSMHFVGMLALALPMPLGYDPAITLASLLIAVTLSTFALQLLRHDTLSWMRLCVGALFMGGGVASMHYTGMAAAQFPVGSICEAARHGVDTGWLALVISILTLAVPGIALRCIRVTERTSESC
jgi:diguanylate cyclase